MLSEDAPEGELAYCRSDVWLHFYTQKIRDADGELHGKSLYGLLDFDQTNSVLSYGQFQGSLRRLS